MAKEAKDKEMNSEDEYSKLEVVEEGNQVQNEGNLEFVVVSVSV